MNYWVMKSEPCVFGIDHLMKRPKQTEPWDGVRNFQARNFIRNMRKGDKAFFYHSNCKIPGITGIIQISSDPYPDDTAFDLNSKYYDPKSTTLNPRWYRVDVTFKKKFDQVISLTTLKQNLFLQNILLIRKGNRLSITPLEKEEWESILAMENLEPAT